MRFPRQEYWSGLPFPSPGDLPDLKIKLVSPALVDGFFTTELLREALICYVCIYVYRYISIYREILQCWTLWILMGLCYWKAFSALFLDTLSLEEIDFPSKSRCQIVILLLCVLVTQLILSWINFTYFGISITAIIHYWYYVLPVLPLGYKLLNRTWSSSFQPIASVSLPLTKP